MGQTQGILRSEDSVHFVAYLQNDTAYNLVGINQLQQRG